MIRSIACILPPLMLALTGCGGSGGGSSDARSVENNSGVIKASIQVEDIPNSLIIDHSNTGIENYLEYQWAVTFDLDNDRSIGAGDIVFRIAEVKSVGEIQREVQFSDLEAVLSQYDQDGILKIVDEIDFEVNGNALTFVVDRSALDDLNAITPQTQVYAIAYMLTPDGFSADYLPAYREFTQVQDVSSVTDELMDYVGDNSAVDISRITLSIFE